MDVIQLKEDIIREHEQECIKTCNEVQDCVNAAIKEIIAENEGNKTFNINYADINCFSVDCCLEQDGGYYFLAYISEGSDAEFKVLILQRVMKKLGIIIQVLMEWCL